MVPCRSSPKKRDSNAAEPLSKGVWQRFHFDDDHPVHSFVPHKNMNLFALTWTLELCL